MGVESEGLFQEIEGLVVLPIVVESVRTFVILLRAEERSGHSAPPRRPVIWFGAAGDLGTQYNAARTVQQPHMLWFRVVAPRAAADPDSDCTRRLVSGDEWRTFCMVSLYW